MLSCSLWYIPFIEPHNQWMHQCKTKLTLWSIHPLKRKQCGNKPTCLKRVCLVEIDHFFTIGGLFLYMACCPQNRSNWWSWPWHFKTQNQTITCKTKQKSSNFCVVFHASNQICSSLEGERKINSRRKPRKQDFEIKINSLLLFFALKFQLRHRNKHMHNNGYRKQKHA